MTVNGQLLRKNLVAHESVKGLDALSLTIGLLTLLLAALYMWRMLGRGWIPHDDGLLAQSAERVFRGQIPHVDFAEAYTGGLSYLNALAFRLWGINLMSLRMMLFLFFLVWVPCFYFCVLRVVRPLASGAITLAAVAWGPPNYAAALPSWYNLFFATGVVAAVFRFIETRHRAWLFVAGLLVGMSCLIKSVGVYCAASVYLFLLFYESSETEDDNSPNTYRSRVYLSLLIGGMALFSVLLWELIRPRLGASEAVRFLLPGLFIAFLVAAEEGGGSSRPLSMRLRSLMRLVVPFTLGISIPLMLFLVPYVLWGAVGAVWKGLAVEPLKRLAYAASAPPPLSVMTPALCLAIALGGPAQRVRSLSVVIPWALGIVLAFLLLHASDVYEYQLTWQTFYAAPPIVVALGVSRLRTKAGRSLPCRQRQQAMLALSTLALFLLIQFPFSAPVYFCYVAPLLLLATASLAKLPFGLMEGAGLPLTLCALLFPVIYVAPGFVNNMGLRSGPDEQTTKLDVPRSGGLRVAEAEAREYAALVAIVDAHSDPGSSILALPDAPEVYFLTNRNNPTPMFFDFFDASYPHTGLTTSAIRASDVPLLVLNSRPGFSARLDEGTLSEAARDYPLALAVGRFLVRWR